MPPAAEIAGSFAGGVLTARVQINPEAVALLDAGPAERAISHGNTLDIGHAGLRKALRIVDLAEAPPRSLFQEMQDRTPERTDE